MNQVNLNIDELQDFVGHIIKNNRYLQGNNKKPVAIEVVGESGIGKTTSIMDMAKEHNLDFVKLNLAQIEELGDLVGFPIKQFQMWKDQDGKKVGKWIDEVAVNDAF
jgi:nucleoside-triphosphatase THEP1